VAPESNIHTDVQGLKEEKQQSEVPAKFARGQSLPF